ncbi:hypothetical protein BAE44_0018094, partial [Dichanthelium oligosanthes]
QMGSNMSPGRLPAAAAATEASSLEDARFKSARITVEERREKIHSTSRSGTSATSARRSRFAKNDDYGEPSRVMQNHDEYDQIAGLKGEDMLDPGALQAHLSEMNSYMYNHTVESWM